MKKATKNAPVGVYADVVRHLRSARPDDRRRWVRLSASRTPGLHVSVIASRDVGEDAACWLRDPDLEARCWHLSLCALTDDSFVDLPDVDLRAWSRGVFGAQLAKTWVMAPASKLDVVRNAPASAYTTHLRLYFDREGRPIQVEARNLTPWALPR